MAGKKIEFTSNYSDLSTNQGFQFEFNCDRCGGGYRSNFKPSATGTVSSVWMRQRLLVVFNMAKVAKGAFAT